MYRIAYAIHHALKLEPQNLHASLPGIQSAQTPAGKGSPLDDIRDAALFLSAAQEFLARFHREALTALRLSEGRGWIRAPLPVRSDPAQVLALKQRETASVV